MSRNLKLNGPQGAFVEAKGPCAVLGAAGTGKTTALVEKIVHLVQNKKVPMKKIGVAVLSYHACSYLRGLLEERIGDKVKNIRIGTFRDHAFAALEAESNTPLKVAENRQIRRLLRHAMRDVGFAGSPLEAEHIIRTFKSRARKPDEKERNYPLFASYRSLLERAGMIDYHDMIRQHLLAIRSGDMKPSAFDYLFVDNVQEVTRVQYLWLMEHVKAGAKLNVLGDDDLDTSGMDGGIGAAVFTDVQEIEKLKKFRFEKNYRSPKKLGEAVYSLAESIKTRLNKNVSFERTAKGQLQVDVYKTPREEFVALVDRVRKVQKEERIAIITRTDWQALKIQRLLEKVGIEHASFAHSVWGVPGAIMMLDLLLVMLGKAENHHLKNILLGSGLNFSLVETLFSQGMTARDWLANGAPLPEGVDLPNVTLKEYGALQRQMVGYYKLMAERSVRPQEVFKAASYDLVMRMSEDDRRNALMAIDMLLALQGNLADKVSQIRESLPSPVDSAITVTPVRDVRNMEFDWVFMPMASQNSYPFAGYGVLGKDIDHEKRLFYMAASRAKKGLYISSAQTMSLFSKDIAARFKG